MSKGQSFVLFLVGIVLGAVFYGIAWGGDRQLEAWHAVLTDRMGPTIGVEYPLYVENAFIEDVELSGDGKLLYVVYRATGMISYGYNPPVDEVWRIIYGVRNGKIVPVGKQRGRVKTEKETLEFDDWCEDCR